MRKEIEIKDRKNEGSSGKMGRLKRQRFTQDNLRGKDRKKGRKERKTRNLVRGVITITSRTPNRQEQKTNTGLLSSSTFPPYDDVRFCDLAKPRDRDTTRRVYEAQNPGAPLPG